MGIRSTYRQDSFAEPFVPQKLWDPIAILEIINPARGSITCVGYAPSCRRRCRNPINQGNRDSAHRLLEALAYIDTSRTDVSGKLRQLAHFTLCVRYHQDQDEEMVQFWSKQIRKQHRMGSNEETLPRGHDTMDDEEFFQSFDPTADQTSSDGLDSLFDRQKQAKRRREEREWIRRLQERVARLEKENQRMKDEAERRQKKSDEERKKRRDEEKRQREESEKKKRHKKRDEEEQQKRAEEESRRRKEQEAKAKEARETEERNERIRQRAEQMRRMREQKAKEQAEKEQEEWDNAWLRYVLQWEKIKINGTRGTSEQLRQTIPWPVKSGNYKDVSEPAIEEFFQKAIPRDSDSTQILAYLKAECLKWHTDRIPRMFGKIEDESLAGLFKTVAQVVVRLRVEKARK